MAKEANLRIGIIGTGRIASRFIPEAALVDGICVQSVYNPHAGSAKRFVESVMHLQCIAGSTSKKYCNEWKLEAYDELEKFYADVDAVYIASPHDTHYEYIRSALAHGKHVLCEKPMVLQKAQAQEVFRYAGEHGLVLFEGIKTAFCPGFARLLEVAESGVIGEIRNVEACFTKLVPADCRELGDLACGGSLTELGSYCILPIIKLLGHTEKQSGSANPVLEKGFAEVRFETITNESGLDIFTKAFFTNGNGIGTATCGLGVKSEGCLLVCGTKGYIIVQAPWWKTTHFEVHYEDAARIDRYDEEYAGDGLRYELQEFVRVIREEKPADCEGAVLEKASRRLTPEESTAIAEVMEEFLRERRGI